MARCSQTKATPFGGVLCALFGALATIASAIVAN
jgi:hypothetical protein